MRWVDELTLIKEIPAGTDDYGDPLPPDEELTVVFANRKSVGISEFYSAQTAGINTTYKMQVRSADYDGQTAAEYDGKRYMILRQWLLENGDITDLTLSELYNRKAGRVNGDV
jgi:hypothetical protein